jgi:hypothetical protein
MARVVTPFGYKLQTELSNEFSRMDSEWFFPWHGLNSGREINLDRFDGRRIRLGGGTYGGSDEGVFWSAIGRYLSNKINEVFDLADKEIRHASQSKVRAIVEDAASVVEEYCWRIRRHAIDTDRRLRGRGNPNPDYSSPHADKMEFTSEIARRKAALVSFHVPEEALEPTRSLPPPLTLSKRFERVYDANKGKWATVALIVGAIGVALRYFF